MVLAPDSKPGITIPRWVFTVFTILVVAWWLSTQPPPKGERGTAPTSDQNAEFEPSIPVQVEPATPESHTVVENDTDPLVIANITIKDQSGRVAFKGDVDLRPTFDRIERGEKFPHRNDGSTFRNLEGRLPRKPAGYYTEYVHPTPELSGPGPQRIVIGKNGEAFYTSDHYGSFRKVRE